MFSFSVCVQYNYRNRGSLTFEPLTLVPIQVKMMNTELLTEKEVSRIHVKQLMQKVNQNPNETT